MRLLIHTNQNAENYVGEVPVYSPDISAVRGLAIVGVVQCHYFAQTHIYEALAVPSPFVSVLTGGGAGVDLFFVLSAYLLTRGLLRDDRTLGAMARFYRRRLFRILPAYWLLLVLGFGLAPMIQAEPGSVPRWLLAQVYPSWIYVAFLQNWYTGLEGKWHTSFFAHT